MEEIEKLWAEFGKLQAKREATIMMVREIEETMRKTFVQIQEKEKILKGNKDGMEK